MELHICQKQEDRQDLQPWQCGFRHPDTAPAAFCPLPSAACQKVNCSFPSSTLKITAVGRKEGRKKGRREGKKEGETGKLS